MQYLRFDRSRVCPVGDIGVFNDPDFTACISSGIFDLFNDGLLDVECGDDFIINPDVEMD
jgi:hypothetical protein